MHILLSNDDGYSAIGLITLAEFLKPLAKITVVAPERNRSGASNSLTLDRPISVKTAANGFYYSNGTPTDCVHLALTGMLETPPDMVISGINDGANMGDDTLYSGTVAAATEGYLLGIPSIAVSMSQHNASHFETAARVIVDLVKKHQASPLSAPTLLSVNVPDIAFDDLKGSKVTRLGRRHKAYPVIKATTPRNEVMYWVGAAGDAADKSEDTDFYAVEHGYVSITPLQVDLTRYSQLADLNAWLRE